MKDSKSFYTSETQMFYERNKIVKCENEFLYDENGKKYLDMNSGTWNVILGYGRKEYNKSIDELNENVQFIPNVRFYHKEGQ